MKFLNYLALIFVGISIGTILVTFRLENIKQILHHNYYRQNKSNFKLTKTDISFLQNQSAIKETITLCQKELVQLQLYLSNQKPEPGNKELPTKEAENRINFLLNKINDLTDKATPPELNRIATKLKIHVASKIFDLQNPEDCSRTKLLICEQKFYCGYGCIMRHIVACVNLGITLNRTVVLSAKKETKMQNTLLQFNSVFRPMTTCLNVTERCRVMESIHKDTISTLFTNVSCINFTMNMRPRASIIASSYSVPNDLMPLIYGFNSEPLAWWNGQIASFVMRPKAWLKTKFEEKEKVLLKTQPIVGVHIRRTDKFITHPVEAYMDHVERWWNREEQRNQLRGNVKNFKRQIYVATDASSVIPKLRSRYSKYQIVHNKVSTTYASGSKRRSDPGLEGLLTDIHILSKCDFVVCGYSSNVCRLVYHLMQSLYADPSDRLYSIDGGYNPLWTTPLTRNRYITIITHRSNTRLNELDVNPGDILEIYDMAQEDPQVKLKGYYWMQNLKTKAEGLVPSYKVKPYPRKSRFSFLD